MKSAKIETITVTLTAEEAYALCNKLDDKALVTHGGYCEYDQIELLQRIGKDLGDLVGHYSAKNDLTLDVRAAVASAKSSSANAGCEGPAYGGEHTKVTVTCQLKRSS